MNIEALLNNTNWSPRQADSQSLALHFLFVIPCRSMVLTARLRHIPPLSFRRDNWLYPYAASFMLHFNRYYFSISIIRSQYCMST